MGNISTYLKWRGDLTFQEKEFNEVDNLVLSQFSYIKLAGIVPAVGEAGDITIEDAAFLYKNKNECLDENFALLELISETQRFKNARLSNCVDILDVQKEQTQFAAIHITLDDNSVYVAFRGTDETIVGWREDFSIGFQISPAQQRAVSYLNETVMGDGKKYRIGGHSKGGNMAVYAAMMCRTYIQEHIMNVYSNDGPGFCTEMIEAKKYKEIQKKLIKIVPEFSVIGMLFEETENLHIIGSNAAGILQHDGMSWEVEGDSFVQKQDLTPKCKAYNQIIENWANDLDLEHRKAFTRDFFDALEAGGAVTMSEAAKGGIHGFETILFAMGSADKKAKIVVWKFLKSFCKKFTQIDYLELIHKKKMWQGGILLLLGVCLVISPQWSLRVIGTGFFAGLLLYSLFRLQKFWKQYQNQEPLEKPKVGFYGTIAGIELFCILKNSIIVLSTNLILGFFFLIRAYKQGRNTAELRAANKTAWIFTLLDAILTLCLGVVALSAFNEVKAAYILTTGTYLVIEGMVSVGRTMCESAEKRAS